MKSIFSIFAAVVTIFLFMGCDELISKNKANTTWELTELFSVSDYYGYIKANPDAGPITSTNNTITITKPLADDIDADAYFTIQGEICTPDGGVPYFLLELVKGTDKTNYWLKGSFNKRIWLRFGPGEYTVNIIEITSLNENSYGVISSWSFYTKPVVSFHVTNTNRENGRYVYPSDVVQSDNETLLNAASHFTGSNALEFIKNIHDWTICYLFYDNESVTFERKKQDALSSYQNGMAVCEGYASLYMALLRARSIPVKYVTGTANGGYHAWNKAFDGSEWKYIDTTWDDPIVIPVGHSDYPSGENLRYTYFWKDGWPDHIPDAVSYTRDIKEIPASNNFPGFPKGSY